MLQFIESPIFSKLVYDYLSESEYAAFQEFLAQHLDMGDVVQGSGGVRKVRWARPGTRKSGGVRVMYYARSAKGQVFLLIIYAKSAKDSIPGHLLKKIKEAMENGLE